MTDGNTKTDPLWSERFTMTDGKTESGTSQAVACHPVQLDPALYPRTLEQPPTFGLGVFILIGVDHDGRYTVFDRDGVKYFGPVAFGEFPEGHPLVEPRFLQVNHFADAQGEDREELWCRDLMMMAGHFHKQRLTAHLQAMAIGIFATISRTVRGGRFVAGSRSAPTIVTTFDRYPPCAAF